MSFCRWQVISMLLPNLSYIDISIFFIMEYRLPFLLKTNILVYLPRMSSSFGILKTYVLIISLFLSLSILMIILVCAVHSVKSRDIWKQVCDCIITEQKMWESRKCIRVGRSAIQIPIGNYIWTARVRIFNSWASWTEIKREARTLRCIIS